jgi:cytoskeletal protein RodZ
MLPELASKYKKPISLGFGGIIVLAVIAANVYAYKKPQTPKSAHIATIEKDDSVTPTPQKEEKPSTIAKIVVEPTKTTSVIQSSTGQSSTPTPTPTPFVTNATPTPTPTATPTPTPQSGTTFKVKYIDVNNNSISLPNMKIKITNSEKGISQESTATPNLEFTNLPSGNYTVEVQPADGYSVWHNVCFNCDGDDHYYNTASLGMGVSENHKYIGLTFKYIAQ